MKQSKRILAYSALALMVMLAAFGAIAFDTSNVAYAQGTVPAAPTLTAVASTTEANAIDLSWNAVDDAVSYELWAWDSVDEWQRLDVGDDFPLTGTSFTHSDLTDGRTYYYQIRAINDEGGMSGWSARVNEVAGDAPDRPELTATAGYEQITVSWAEVTGAARYELWAWDGAWAQLDGGSDVPLTATSYTQTGLTAGRTIYYQGRAVNAGGVMSAWSAQVNATVLTTATIGALQSLVASAADGRVTLTWTAPTSDGGLGITGYQYRYGETGVAIGEWTAVGDVLTVTVPNLVNETGYDFEVRAFNSGGNGPASTASATPKDAPTAPSAPGSLRAAPSADSVTLTWTASAANGAPITRYEYQSYETSGTAPQTWTSAGDVLSVTISNLTKGTSYTFNVRAVNSIDPGAAATVASTPSSEPSAPQNLIATGGNGIITLSWGAPADTGGSAIANYRIEKYNAASTNWGHLGNVSGTADPLEYIDRTVTIGATTEYRVRAMNANTNDPSAWATASGVAQGRGVPGMPTELKANRGDGSISYTWEAPDSNGGASLIRYEYRHFPTTDVPGATDEWTSASLRTGVSFPNLESDTVYGFQVRAVNVVGAGEMATLPMTPAATTPSLPRRFEAQADNNDAEIELSWDDPQEDGGADVTAYHLQSKEGADGDWTDVPDWEADETNTDDEETFEELTWGATYYYRIRAINTHSLLKIAAVDQTEVLKEELDALDWAEANATVVSSWPAQVAAAPMTTFEDGRITVTWVKPLDHGQPITTYNLRWMSGTETTFPAANVVEVQAPATEYIMIGPDPANDYQFQVLAVNSLTEDDEIDNSVLGNALEADGLPIKWSPSSTELPVPEVNVQDTYDVDNANGLRVVPASDGRATITWRMERDLANDGDVEYTVASYDLEWIELGPPEGSTTLPTDLPDADERWDDATSESLAAQALMQRIIGPLPGNTSLFVRLRVVSTVGTPSGWTPAATTTINARAPDHPELTATIIGQNVILSWDEPESNGSRIERYELQFKKDDGDFGDHDGDDDASDNDDNTDEDTVDNDVIRIETPDPDNAGQFLTPPTSYSHEDLDGGATYTYRIRTVTTINSVDYSNSDADLLATALASRTWSDEVEATSDRGPDPDPVVPGIPVLTANPDNADGTIDLKWEEPSEGTSPITSYQLQRWNGSAWENLPASLDSQDEEYTDATVELGQMYYYAIRAVSSAGMGQWTQRDFPNAMLNSKAPAKINLSLAVDKQAITLSWDTPEDNGASIAAYQIQVTTTGPVGVDADNRMWGDGAINGNTLSPIPALATTYTHSGLTPGRTYYYRVRAVNVCNDADNQDDAICGDDETVTVANAEDWSDEEDETTAPIAPSAPGADTADFGGSNLNDLEAEGGDAKVDLVWTLPGPDSDFNDVNHLGTGGAHITSVEVQRWNTSRARWDDIKVVAVGYNDDEVTPLVYNPGSQMYSDTGLEDGTGYTYRVRAVNSAGESPWSNMISATTDADAPDTPTLTATVSGQDVVLNWNTPDANGKSIMRYELQRFPSIGPDGDDVGDDPDVINDWGDDAVDSTTPAENDLGGTSDNDVIVPMPAGVTTYTDRGLQPGTPYYYRIRAVNVCNDDANDATNDNDCSPDQAVNAVNDAARTWSTDINVNTAPMAPDKMTLTLAGGENMITLTWTRPDNNGSTITEYEIERWNSVDRQWDPLKSDLPVSVLSYVDDELEAGTRYFYRIRAVNAGGEGAWSTLTQATTDAAAQ